MDCMGSVLILLSAGKGVKPGETDKPGEHPGSLVHGLFPHLTFINTVNFQNIQYFSLRK